MYSTLLCLVAIGVAVWFWRDSMRAREAAAGVCRRVCRSNELQFLDDTVALAALRPLLDRGRPALRRVYRFEYSRDGYDRHTGSLSLVADRVETVFLEAATGTDVERRH